MCKTSELGECEEEGTSIPCAQHCVSRAACVI